MIAIALVLVVVAGAYAQLPTNCGQTPIAPDVSEKIVGGKEARRHSWPWQISLRQTGSHICGGSIIHPSYVVTAAHCTEGSIASRFSLRAGRHTKYDVEANEQIGSPQRMWEHENYNTNTLNNDITLFRITSPFRFNDYVQPVCLASYEITTAGTPVIATGWGQVQGTCCDERLKQATLPFVTRTACRQAYGIVTTAQICAGYTPYGDNVCRGDSGGPLVYKVNGKWEQHGISSAVTNYTCINGGPALFANVNHLKPWILAKIETAEAEEAEVAARGVRPIPYGSAFRRSQQQEQPEESEQSEQVEQEAVHEAVADVHTDPFEFGSQR